MLQTVISIFAICLAAATARTSGPFDSPYVVTEKVPEDPEPEYSPAPAKYKNLLGNLLAGQTEFPWIVDVKVPYLDQLDSVGNLLTKFHVLITCRTIVNYQKYLPTGVGTQITYYEGPGSMRISFASMFLTEIERSSIIYLDPDSDKRMAGTRIAAWVLMHPDCDKGRNYASDFAIIGLSRPILLMPPYIALAPIWHSALTATIRDINDWVPLTTKFICWVGAWGRNYSNVEHPITLRHKVKIRAYAYPDFTKCLQIWSLLCPANTLADKDICRVNVPAPQPSGLICMYTRSPVGAVCDTNKGAPVVCNGRIYGLVARGVPLDHCNSTNPKPFVVVNMHRLEQGNPPLYSGQLVSQNKKGAAPHIGSDAIILYTRSGCPENAVGIPAFIAFLLLLRLFQDSRV